MLLTFLMLSCAKEQQQPSTQLAEKFNHVKSMEDKRMLFSMLTAQEKTELAKDHLDFCASYYGFTETQLAALDRIKSYLLTVYSSSDPENTTGTASIQLDVIQYFASLSEEQRLITFSSMVVDEVGIQEMIAGTGSNIYNDCNCNPSSNYCMLDFNCSLKKNCEGSAWGCGTLFTYSCKGKCTLFS